MDYFRIVERLQKVAAHAAKTADFGVNHKDIDAVHFLSAQLDPNSEDLDTIVHEMIEDPEKYLTSTSRFKSQMQRITAICELLKDFPPTQGRAEANSNLFPEFVLPKTDEDRFFRLCSEIRKIVLASEVFDEPHKRRLLNRVAAIEHEAKQPNGKLDVVLAGVVDIGDALGKFGKSIEPLTKRIKEIAQIARSGSKEYEQIPAPEETKALPPPEEE